MVSDPQKNIVIMKMSSNFYIPLSAYININGLLKHTNHIRNNSWSNIFTFPLQN